MSGFLNKHGHRPAPPAAQEAGPNAPAERGAWRNMDLPWLNKEFQEKPIENQWAGGDPPNSCALDRLTLLAYVRDHRTEVNGFLKSN